MAGSGRIAAFSRGMAGMMEEADSTAAPLLLVLLLDVASSPFRDSQFCVRVY
jgi:hypothetical protein